MYKTRLKSLIDLRQESILILFLPFLAYSIPRIVYSAYFSYYKLALYLIIIILFDLLYKKVYPGRHLPVRICFILFTAGFITFLYSSFLVLPIRSLLYEHYNVEARGRSIFLFLFLLIAGIKMLFLRKRVILNLLVNRAMLFFTLLIIAGELVYPPAGPAIMPASAYKGVTAPGATQPRKPVVLILLDEYHSPDELAKYTTDSDLYSFSTYLTRNGWQVKNRLYSYETGTVYSLSSLYNFNLSEGGNYAKITELRALDLLDKARFADSLEKKQVKMVNLSFFNIGKNKLYTYVYPVPNSFFDLFFYFSGLLTIKIGTGNFELKGMEKDFYNTSAYNQDLLTRLPRLLDSNTNTNLYIYAHFLMPHNPILFSNEIKLGAYNLGNYYQYWKFSANKIKTLLDSVHDLYKYRVIITGDHGFRNDPRINPHFTFAAFYGFDSLRVTKINCVQDIGGVINDYF